MAARVQPELSDYESDSDCENVSDDANSDTEGAGDKGASYSNVESISSGKIWRDVAESQSLEESMSDVVKLTDDFPRKTFAKRSPRKDNSERRASNFSRRMKRFLHDSGLKPLKNVLAMSVQEVADFRKKWLDFVGTRRRFLIHTLGHRVMIPALDCSNEKYIEFLPHEIAWNIQEEKIDVVARFLEVVGLEEMIKAYNNMRDIEAAGGIPTSGNQRRRSAGGTLMQLLKKNSPQLESAFKDVFKIDVKISKCIGHREKAKHVRQRTENCKRHWEAKVERNPDCGSRVEEILKRRKLTEVVHDVNASSSIEKPQESTEDFFVLDLGLDVADEIGE